MGGSRGTQAMVSQTGSCVDTAKVFHIEIDLYLLIEQSWVSLALNSD